MKAICFLGEITGNRGVIFKEGQKRFPLKEIPLSKYFLRIFFLKNYKFFFKLNIGELICKKINSPIFCGMEATPRREFFEKSFHIQKLNKLVLLKFSLDLYGSIYSEFLPVV